MVTITIIDSGVSKLYREKFLKGHIVSLQSYEMINGKIIKEDGADDNIGHGTMVCSAINLINKNVDFNIIKIFDSEYWGDELLLLEVLKEIYYSDRKTDIIHISSGIQMPEHKEEMEEILWKLRKKGIIIVSAFSNNQILSYPASYESVIGVMFDTNILSTDEWIYVENSPVNIIATGNPKNLIDMNGKLAKVAGTSFTAAFITGHIAKMLETTNYDNIYNELKMNSYKYYTVPDIIHKQIDFDINKIVIFPFNKENQSIVRNNYMLGSQLVSVLDVKYSPYIGRDAFQLFSINDYNIDNEHQLSNKKCIIENIMDFDWSTDFDTFVLGHIELLNKAYNISLYDYIYSKCISFYKNLYSYDPIPDIIRKRFTDKGLKVYYPHLCDDNSKINHCGLLYEIASPVVGVFGTSTKQGKWSLQLKIREILSERGYKTGHLGTEPQSLLFKNTEICAIGFGSDLPISQLSVISTFNNIMHNLDHDTDILLFGTQSCVIPYAFGGLKTIPTFTHELICACEPQASILCINEWDDPDYIKRCINYLESFSGNKVIALSFFFKDYQEKWDSSGMHVNLMKYDFSKIENLKKIFDLPIYNMSYKNEIEMLCDDIINYF